MVTHSLKNGLASSVFSGWNVTVIWSHPTQSPVVAKVVTEAVSQLVVIYLGLCGHRARAASTTAPDTGPIVLVNRGAHISVNFHPGPSDSPRNPSKP